MKNTGELLSAADFEKLAGWATLDHGATLAAFQLSARQLLATRGDGFRPSAFGGTPQDWLPIAEAALSATNARDFFEAQFLPCTPGMGPAFFTGYYTPQLRGALRPGNGFTVPLYAPPLDPTAFSRREIDEGALSGRGLELCWLESAIDAYFVHVQGQARVQLLEGGSLHLSFAAKNRKPYVSIGQLLLARGLGTKETMSMEFLRQYLAAQPREGQALLWQNPSYVFFRKVEVPDPALGGFGAGKVPLTPQGSLAVDRAFWAFGTPMWLETRLPDGTGFNRMLIAQDTGSAIKGPARGDIYFGWGAEAAFHAGNMKAQGRIYALLPKALAAKLTA